MSRRQRSARDSAQRLKVARDKAQRRRSRARRAAGAAAAAVTLAGGGTAGLSPAQAATGSLLTGASLADCSSTTTPDSDPSYLTDVGGDLYFTAFDGEHGQALWKSDGTASGTVLLKEFGSSGGYDDYDYGYGSGASDLTDVAGTLFFTVDGDGTDELWRSDGTPAGTVKVRRFASLGGGYDDEDDGALTAVGDTLFFVADDGTHGDELWRSDGTKSGTVLVKDIGRGTGDDYDYYSEGPGNLTAAGDTLFFTTDDGTHGDELWRSDGTKAGTVQVRNVRPGSYSSEIRSLTAVGDDVYFTARDGVHGRELWTSDGTKEGTVLVEDIRPGGGTAVSGPLVATDDGTVFFAADDGTDGRDLWRSDGTPAGTALVKDLGAVGDDYYDVGDMEAVGNTLFFAGSDGTHGLELWTSDGTEAGTVMVKDIRPGDYDGYPTRLTEVAGEVFFVARDGVHGAEVWRSDGTKAGTVLVKDIDPDAPGSRPGSLTELDGRLYFTADDSVHGEELWTSDGTEAGTVLVADINTGGAFVVSSKGVPNTDKGTVRVRVVTDGAGTLSVARNRWVRGSSRDVVESGDDGVRFNVTLEPTRAAKRVLRREGELRVRARFTFSSCGGAVNSVTHHYTLRMG